MADRWRVTMKIAWFPTRPLTLVRIILLACALTEDAVLLRTSVGGLVIVVWVTETSRCRFRDRLELLFLSIALQFPGSTWTKSLVPIRCVVLTYLLLAVPRWLQWTPLTMALANRPMLRSMTFKDSCRLGPPTLVMETLLHRTRLRRTLQNWPTRPAMAAPLVLAVLMSVTPRLGPVN